MVIIEDLHHVHYLLWRSPFLWSLDPLFVQKRKILFCPIKISQLCKIIHPLNCFLEMRKSRKRDPDSFLWNPCTLKISQRVRSAAGSGYGPPNRNQPISKTGWDFSTCAAAPSGRSGQVEPFNPLLILVKYKSNQTEPKQEPQQWLIPFFST